MHTKPMLWALVVALCSSVMFSSCQSSKTAFGNSYYFKQNPKTVDKAKATVALEEVKKVAPNGVAPNGAELYTSLEQGTITERDASTLIKQAQQQLIAAVDETDNAKLKASALRMNQLAEEMNGQELTKKEKRTKRKEIRKEIRSLAKEYKSMAPNESNDMDTSLKMSIILLGGGLVFLIIGGLGIPILGLLGLLAMIAGIVLLIIWAANS